MIPMVNYFIMSNILKIYVTVFATIILIFKFLLKLVFFTNFTYPDMAVVNVI